MYAIASAGLSDIGRKRATNQDHYLVDDAHLLYLVADGMGGHQAGETAARLVVDSMGHYFSAGSPATDPPADGPHDPSLSAEANRLQSAIQYANQQVYQASVSTSAFAGMGSTLAAILFAGSTFVAANVGDSPIYLIHEGIIETLSVPHTLMAEQPDNDVLGPELRHVLTRGMGIAETVRPDICQSPCFAGDRLILCSDGLSDKVAAEEILAVVAARTAGDACQALVAMANQRGGDDNITVIVLHVEKKNTFFRRFGRWMSH